MAQTQMLKAMTQNLSMYDYEFWYKFCILLGNTSILFALKSDSKPATTWSNFIVKLRVFHKKSLIILVKFITYIQLNELNLKFVLLFFRNKCL